MSKEAVAKVIQRAISDGAFRRQLSTDPTKALRGFDLSPAETAAIRSGDSGRLSAFGVDVRMSKAFTLAAGDGSASGASFSVSSDLGASNTGVLQSPDAADRNFAVSTADVGSAGAVQSPDAAERNLGISTGDAGSAGAVQSPDAADRNFAYSAGDAGATGAVQSPDAADRNFAYSSTGDAGATGAVQSPDAADRNFVQSAGGVEPRDVAPTDIGDYQQASGVIASEPRDVAPTDIGDYQQASGVIASEPRDVAPTDIGDNQQASGVISSEPRDVAPTDIGDNQPLSNVIPSEATGGNELIDGATDEGYLPTVNYADDAAGGAGDTHAPTETDGPNIDH
jgi:hypothetical protein